MLVCVVYSLAVPPQVLANEICGIDSAYPNSLNALQWMDLNSRCKEYSDTYPSFHTLFCPSIDFHHVSHRLLLYLITSIINISSGEKYLWAPMFVRTVSLTFLQYSVHTLS